MGVVIRAAGPESAHGIARLELALGHPEWDVESVCSTLGVQANHGLVALKEGTQVGHILYSHVVDELEILTVAVDQAHRREGIARQLIEHATEVTTARVLHLDVRASNEPALALYRGLGFVEVGRRSAYYRCGEDAIVMRASPAGADAGT